MSEWHDVTLADISDQRKGINYKSEYYCDEDSGHPFITIKCFVKGGGYQSRGIKYFDGPFTPQDKLSAGDVLISVTDLTRAGDIVGSPLQVPDFGSARSALASMDCMKIAPQDGKCDSEFLYFRMMLSDIRRQMVAYSTGSTVLHLDTKKVPSMKIRIPKDIGYQKKLAGVLKLLSESIEQTEVLIEKYSLVKAGMMHDLFTRGLTPDGKLRPPREEAPDLYKETPIGWIPKEWEQPELQDICGHLITYGIVQAGPDIEGGVPYIRTGDMSGDSLVKDKMLRTSQKIANAFKRSEVKAGEIVCAIRATVGKVLIVPEELDGANLTQGTARIAPKDDVDNRFVAWGFRSSAVQKSIMLCIKGTTFNEITLGDLRELPFSIPSTEHEQGLLADRLDQCQHLVDAESSKLAKLLKEKKGLMHDLLTGEVPVKTNDPEAAHV